MRITTILGVLAAASLAVAACGSSNKTVTVKFTGSSTSLSMVVTGDSNAIDGFQQGVKESLSSAAGSGASVTQSDGDQHDGNQICATDVTSSGVTLHVVVYSPNSSLSPSICSAFQSAVASASP